MNHDSRMYKDTPDVQLSFFGTRVLKWEGKRLMSLASAAAACYACTVFYHLK